MVLSYFRGVQTGLLTPSFYHPTVRLTDRQHCRRASWKTLVLTPQDTPASDDTLLFTNIHPHLMQALESLTSPPTLG